MERLQSFLAALQVDLPNVTADSDRLETILNVVFAITGAIAVLIIVLAGFRFIISQGNPNDIATARSAIIYSLVGLIVIMFAYAIVRFVVRGTA